MTRQRILWICVMAVLWCAPKRGAAQLAPTGAHYGGHASDTGREGPNDQGGYSSSVPLDLPPSRGGLPIPLSIVSGAHGFGAAGVGWDIPISYVFVDDSFAHRRPSMLPGADARPRERVTVALLGRTVEMVPRGSEWIGRYAPDLSMRFLSGVFTITDGEGVSYTFTQDPVMVSSGGPYGMGGFWLLQSMHGRGGAAVNLAYRTGVAPLPGSPSVTSTIDLSSISYNPDATATCFKHVINLQYGTDTGITPQALSIIGERVVARFHRLASVDITSRGSCGDPSQLLRRYNFTYSIDPDTSQERLAAVSESAREGSAEALAGQVLPIANYRYGSATTVSSGALALKYQYTNVIPLPIDTAIKTIGTTRKATASQFQAPVGASAYTSAVNLMDFTGDGRPDFLFPVGPTQSVAPIRSAMAVGTSAPLNGDATLTLPALDARSSDTDRFNEFTAAFQNLGLQHDYVWTQSIDMNGDGRVDIISGAEQPKTWVLYLNTPGPGPSGIKWVRRTLDVSALYQHFVDRGIAPPNSYLPLSARITGRNFGTYVCWEWDHGAYVQANAGLCDPQTAPPTVGPEQTYTLYEVTDVNGDGYPDVVFNHSAVGWATEPPPPYTGVHVLQQRMTRLGPSGSNLGIDVAYNVRGLFTPSDSTNTNPFSNPEWLTASGCGVEKWIGDDVDGDRIQVARCGFAEINGDGLLDRIEDGGLFLGTGFGYNTVKIPFPAAAIRKFVAAQQSQYTTVCTGSTTLFNATQVVGLRDLTGDGIPDLVEPKPGGGSVVFVGTGAGFAETPISIEGPFAFSHTDERCDGTESDTSTGLYDVNGDGKADFVSINGGSINVYQLAGGSQPGVPEAGRLVGIDNGYGALTSITYTSAKEDSTTPHQVPFPEIVVATTQTTGHGGGQGLGGTLATTRYAYGNVSQFYDSILDAFRSSGYQRRIELNSVPGAKAGTVQMSALIVDKYPLSFVSPIGLPYMTDPQRFGRYLQNGRVSDVTTLAASLDADPWTLLTVDVTTDTRRIGAVHYAVDTGTARYFADTTPPGDDACKDIMFPYDYSLSVANNFGTYSPCSARGFLYTSATQTWKGASAPPSSANVQTGTSIRSVDDSGRVTSIFYQNDGNQTDDDFCVDTAFAIPTAAALHVWSAVSTRKVWACGPKGDGRVYAQESWEYDGLSLGNVTQGLPSAHIVERHATDTGQDLGIVREYDATYNSYGAPVKVLTKREDNASRTTDISYDSFGVAAANTKVTTSDGSALVSTQTVDPISGQLLSRTDENGTTRGATYDGFGRLVAGTIKTPADTTPGVLVARRYLGFDGTDPAGRRISVEHFTDPVAQNAVGTGLGRVSTTYYDELGRPRYEQAGLGADYSNDSMIVGARTYDLLGRVSYEADPYPASQSAATAYGTSRYFAADGSLWAEIRGNGPQPFTSVSNPASEVFPTISTHVFANYTDTTIVQDADALTTGSVQFGVTHQATTSAIGRVLTRSTMQAGARLEYSTFSYVPLGQQSSMVRYQNAMSAANSVSSTWRYDSLGQLIELDEPTSAPQTRSYSAWGELKSVTWHPPAPELLHSVASVYDALGRVTTSEEFNGGVGDAATLNRYTYDTAGTSSIFTPTYFKGRLTAASSPTESTVFSYDGYGRVNARGFTGDKNEYVEQESFHGDGSSASITLRLPDNAYAKEEVDYDYDSAAQMRWMWFSDGINTQELYNATTLDSWGRLRQASFGGSDYTAGYAATGRRLPTEVKVTSSAGTRYVGFTGFDPVGRETGRDEVIPSYPGHLASTYDALGRLNKSTTTNGASTTSKWAFAYDPLGNVQTLDDQVGTSDASLSYLSTDRDQICGVSFTGAPTNCNVDYDSFGNVVTEPTRTGYDKIGYFINGDVRRIQDQSGTTASFTYDASGEVHGVDISGPSGSRQDRNYGGLITQRNQKGAGGSSSYVARRFPGPGLTISRQGAKGPWVYEFAGSGGTRFTLDEKGNYLQDIHYTPFGQGVSSGAAPGNQSFTTEQWNGGDALDGLGLVKVGKRLYDPAIGRFLSRDPLFIPRTSVTTNPYAFAMNDPVNLSDPSGLDPCAAQPLCISSSLNGESSSALATAATLGILAADLLIGGGSEPPMANMSGPQIAAYSAAFDGQLAQHRLSVATSQVMGAGDSGNWASNLVGGVGDGFYDLGAGLVHSALHPVQTVRGLGHAIAHPIQTGRAIGRSVRDTTQAILAGDTRALGHAMVGVVASVGPGAAEKALVEMAEVAEVAKVAKVAEVAKVAKVAKVAEVAAPRARFIVTESGVAIPTDAGELRSNLKLLNEQSTNPASSRKFIGEDSQGPLRVRVEKAHAADPSFSGTPDPLHTVDHLHIDRRSKVTSGPWGSDEKVAYDWPF